MASRLRGLTIDALEPARLADFWAGLLQWEPTDDPGAGIAPPPGFVGGMPVRFQPTQEPKTMRNLLHLDLACADVPEQEATVARALSLGGRHVDVGQLPEEDHVVLADPEGNELCVTVTGSFLAGCGLMGCLSCDGSPAVGHFWAEALGWDLVWDQDEETAIQSPAGGTKISWGGPPYMPRPPKNRWHLDLVALDDGEVERLLGLGARRVDVGQGDAAWTVLADPDGNELCVYPSSPGS